MAQGHRLQTRGDPRLCLPVQGSHREVRTEEDSQALTVLPNLVYFLLP